MIHNTYNEHLFKRLKDFENASLEDLREGIVWAQEEIREWCSVEARLQAEMDKRLGMPTYRVVYAEGSGFTVVRDGKIVDKATTLRKALSLAKKRARVEGCEVITVQLKDRGYDDRVVGSPDIME